MTRLIGEQVQAGKVALAARELVLADRRGTEPIEFVEDLVEERETGAPIELCRFVEVIHRRSHADATIQSAKDSLELSTHFARALADRLRPDFVLIP